MSEDTTEERKPLPEVQTYITAKDTAEEALAKANAAVRGKHDYVSPDGECTGCIEQTKAHEAYQVAVNTAWNDLGKSSDPLVRWIVGHCKEYQARAVDVLKALPATLYELEDIAQGEDWCYIWNRFREQAIEAGVIEGPKPLSPARQALDNWLDDDFGMGSASRRKVQTLVDAVVAEESATEGQAA